MDSADGTRRAKIFAFAAAYAAAVYDARNPLGGTFLADHRNGACRAAGSAFAAAGLTLGGKAEVIVDERSADVDHSLFLLGDRKDGAGRADLRTGRALRPAIAVLEAHLGLHQVVEVGTGTKDFVGTVRHAKLAGGAMPVEMLDAFSSGRHERSLALRSLLGDDGREAAVVLGVERGSRSGHQRSDHERAARGVRSLRLSRCGRSFTRAGGHRFRRLLRRQGETIPQRTFGALLNAVETDDAARAVDLMRLTVYAGGLAVLVAFAAGDALALVDGHAEEREARYEAQGRADWADIVTPRASVGPGQISHAGKGKECDQRDHPSARMDYARHDTAVSAVRGDEGHKYLDTKHKAKHESCPDGIP